MAIVYFNYLMFEIDMFRAQLRSVWWQNVEYLHFAIFEFCNFFVTKEEWYFCLDRYILPHRVPDHICSVPCWHHLSCPWRFRCYWAGQSHQLHHPQRQFSHHLIHCQWRHSLLGSPGIDRNSALVQILLIMLIPKLIIFFFVNE